MAMKLCIAQDCCSGLSPSSTSSGSGSNLSSSSSTCSTQDREVNVAGLQQHLLELLHSRPQLQRQLASKELPERWERLLQEDLESLPGFGFEAVEDVLAAFGDLSDDALVQHLAIQQAMGPTYAAEIVTPLGHHRAAPTKQSLLRLLMSLNRSFSHPDFQLQVENLKKHFPAGAAEGYFHLPGRADLAFTAQEKLLPCCGFPGNKEGVQQMLVLCAKHLEDQQVSQLVDAVNMKLGMMPEACHRFRKVIGLALA